MDLKKSHIHPGSQPQFWSLFCHPSRWKPPINTSVTQQRATASVVAPPTPSREYPCDLCHCLLPLETRPGSQLLVVISCFKAENHLGTPQAKSFRYGVAQTLVVAPRLYLEVLAPNHAWSQDNSECVAPTGRGSRRECPTKHIPRRAQDHLFPSPGYDSDRILCQLNLLYLRGW